jgi:hypothetical protein
MTFVVNANVRNNLRWVNAADSAAKAYVCAAGERTAGDDEFIKQQLTLPAVWVFYAKYDDAYNVTYWKKYLEHLRNSPFWRCPEEAIARGS